MDALVYGGIFWIHPSCASKTLKTDFFWGKKYPDASASVYEAIRYTQRKRLYLTDQFLLVTLNLRGVQAGAIPWQARL